MIYKTINSRQFSVYDTETRVFRKRVRRRAPHMHTTWIERGQQRTTLGICSSTPTNNFGWILSRSYITSFEYNARWNYTDTFM